jgi:RNA polymerase sigma-70 factor (ECF subfamily)
MNAHINTLLIRIQQGEVEAMNELYIETKRGVFSFILPYLNDVHLSEDIMQETYMKIFQNIQQYHPQTNGLNWILTIAKNTAINLIHVRQREDSFDAQDMNDRLDGGLDTYDLDSPIIQKAKEILPKDEATIVFLYAIGEYKHREIASMLSLPLGTVTWKYNKAMKTLKEVFAHER